MATRKYIEWKTLEDRVIKDSLYLGRPCFKVPERIKIIGRREIRLKTPFDFFSALECGKCCVFDAKKTNESQFLFSTHLKPDKIHQFQALESFEQSLAFAGYLVWFFKDHKIGFITVSKIKQFLSHGKKKITINDIPTLEDTLPICLQTFYNLNK